MLGLGNSLISGKAKNLIFTYTSDFSSDVDSWEKHTPASGPVVHVGTPTITANEGTGDAADGAGWLKIIYGADQTTSAYVSGSIIRDSGQGGGIVGGQGDIAVVNFKVKLIHDGSTDHWGGTDDVFLTSTVIGKSTFTEIALNTTTTVSYTTISSTDYVDDISIAFSQSGDRPLNGATWYLKDYNIQIFR